MCNVVFYNGSGHKVEIQINNEMREPLNNFLVNQFQSQIEKYYLEIKQELTVDL